MPDERRCSDRRLIEDIEDSSLMPSALELRPVPKMAEVIRKGESVESNIKAACLAKKYGFATLGTL